MLFSDVHGGRETRTGGKSTMRIRTIAALLAALAIPVLALTAPAAPAGASGGAPSGCTVLTDSGADGGFSLTDNGENAQVTTTRTANCYTWGDATTVSGVTYYELKDSSGYCLTTTSNVLYSKTCEATPPDSELWTLSSANLEELVNPGGLYITADSIASGADVVTSSTSTLTAETDWALSTSASHHILPTYYPPYPGYNGPGFTTLEDTTPEGAIQDVVTEICAPDGTCGGMADEANPNWQGTSGPIDEMEAAGITPLYYISTDFDSGGKGYTLSDIETDINNAITWYGTRIGFMFDEESPSTGANLTYYQDIYKYVTETEGLTTPVMFNPGTDTITSAFMFGSQVIQQVFEGDATTFSGTTFPTWMGNYPASEFSATISDCNDITADGDECPSPVSDVATLIAHASNSIIGNVYIDDEAEPPGYDTLPSYLDNEVADAIG
jgi:hypothetical protein